MGQERGGAQVAAFWGGAGGLVTVVLAVLGGGVWVYKVKTQVEHNTQVLSEAQFASGVNKGGGAEFAALEARVSDLEQAMRDASGQEMPGAQIDPLRLAEIERKLEELQAVQAERKDAGSLATEPRRAIPYSYRESISQGEAFVDPFTGAVLGLQRVDRSTAYLVSVTLPGQETVQFREVPPGTTWPFTLGGRSYRLILVGISRVGYSAEVREGHDSRRGGSSSG